ncbi:hypothetical protein EDD29_4124 [Actinocorallia herbida]|uniref:DUF3592 domain-containing protein n=1 Tax=Actinocorallia herbida TaxID=58109 RepID=A0A3N1CZ39_9ACTN|nr:hypothetical protein [Actinocorallia herbida]ROO86551.1 hypothetical protein EDD29_4124 [Actinocorallia herbida]
MGGVGWGKVVARGAVLVGGGLVVCAVTGWASGAGGLVGGAIGLGAALTLVGAWMLLDDWGPAWAAVATCLLAGLPLLALQQAGVPANLYLRAAGDRTQAVVVGVEHVTTKRGGYDVYRLAGADGRTIDGDLEGAADGLAPGAPLDVVVDPAGILEPRLAAETDDRDHDILGLVAFAAWTLLVAMTLVLGELAARRGTPEARGGAPTAAGPRRFVPESVGVRAALITVGLAAASLLEGWAIAAFPSPVPWILGVPLGIAALGAPFLLAAATKVKVDGQQAWWPAWTGLLFAGAVFIGGCVIPKDAYLNAFGDRTTGTVAGTVCEQTDANASGCYYEYTLTDPEGRPYDGTLGAPRLYGQGTELPILADPRGDVAPQLVTDDRADFAYRFAAVGLVGFAATSLAATLKHRSQQRTPAPPPRTRRRTRPPTVKRRKS